MAKKILISAVPELYPSLNLEMVDDNRFDILQDDYWWAEKEADYNRTTAKLDKACAEYKLYKIYTWYDISGWEYWIKKQKEPNYAQVTVAYADGVNSLTKHQILTLEKRLFKVVERVQQIILKFKN